MLARSGDIICKKTKLKNFCDPKLAGGCGVVPFLSANVLFCGAVAAPAQRGGRDLFQGWRWEVCALRALWCVLGGLMMGIKKPAHGGHIVGSGNDTFVPAPGLCRLRCRLAERGGSGGPAGAGV